MNYKLNISTLDNVNSSLINKIISEDYKTYSKMEALEYLIHGLMDKNALPISTPKVLGEGSSGFAQLVKIFGNSNLVIKTNDEKTNPNINASNEYLVGSRLNVLRQYTPCFAYMFGKMGKSVIYEYGGEQSLHNWKKNNPNNVDDFLLIIIQVLLSIEVAQERYRFIHNDLHGSNIMLRDKRDSYTLLVGNTEYKFNNVIVPCIIDYGLSYIQVGEEYLPHYNGVRKHLFVQGFDQYFLLADCVSETGKGNIQSASGHILTQFYKATNPYSNMMNIYDKCAKVYTSMSATNTPIEIVQFILQSFNNPMLAMRHRTVYIIQKPSIDIYEQLLGPNSYTLEVPNCKDGCKSLIVSKYFNLKDTDKYELEENDRCVISEMLAYLNTVDVGKLIGTCNIILGTRISTNTNVTEAEIDTLIDTLAFVTTLNMLYYMCLEMKDDVLLPLFLILSRQNTENIKNHILNINYYDRAVNWYMTVN